MQNDSHAQDRGRRNPSEQNYPPCKLHFVFTRINIKMGGKPFDAETSLNFKPIGNWSNRTKLVVGILFLIFVVTEASFLFWQFGEIIQKKSAKDISLIAFSILLGANVIWVLYALFIVGSTPILVSGLLYVVGCVMIIAATIYYGDGSVNVN